MPADPTIHDQAVPGEAAAQQPPAAAAEPSGPAAPSTEPESPSPSADGGLAETDEGRAQAETDHLAQLAVRAEKADEYLALAQRKQAEFENFRKRAQRDAQLAAERGATKLAKELLPAVDNLERALEHAPDDADTPDGAQVITAFVAGVRHVHADLVAGLQRAGIEQFSPQGELFDPTLHEAVAQQPIEGAQPGTVVEVFQRGYRVGETIVRPARVVVAG